MEAFMLYKSIVCTLCLVLGTVSTNSISSNTVSTNSIVEEDTLTLSDNTIEVLESVGSSSATASETGASSTTGLKLKASVCTEKSYNYTMSLGKNGGYVLTTHGNWASVPELIHYVDNSGNLVLAYSDSKYVYLDTVSDDSKSSSTVKIKKKYPLLGDVISDSSGNVYIVWGQENSELKSSLDTMAISKYSSAGKHIKTTKFTSSTSNPRDTMVPFEAGTCDSAICNGVLVCSYARKMYSGHQSNDVIAVNISDMSVNNNYSNYTSHSFDQRVLATSNNKVIFANLGDAYPRGFTVGEGTETYFHFYGTLGDNHTRATLGNVCEMSSGILYSGSAPKSLSSKSKSEAINLFVQLASSDKQLPNSVSRTGVSCGSTVTDTGIVWLTNYKSTEDVKSPKMIKLSDTYALLVWEKFVNDNYSDTYYVIINSNGKLMTDITSLNGERLNTFEQPVLVDNYVMWATAGSYKFKELNDGTYGYTTVDDAIATLHYIDVSKYLSNNDNKSTLKKGDTFKAGNYTYYILNTAKKYVTVKAPTNKNIKTVSIPTSVTHDGVKYKVTEISPKAFKDCPKLKAVTIGSSVTKIGGYAFYNCKKLTKVTVGKNVKTLGNYCFSKSKALKKITFKGTKLKTVGKKVFKSTNSKLTIKVPKSKLSAYKKLFKNKGLSKSSKITK